jgi:integrase
MATILQFKENISQSWESSLEEFLIWKKAEGRSERTLSDYKIHISNFFRRYPHSFNDGTLKRSLLEYLSQDYKPATYNLRLAYIKAFLNWCVEEGTLSSNPISKLKKRKDEGRIVDIDLCYIRQLIDIPKQGTFAGFRDYCLILLTLDTGIRPNEALHLQKGDINLRSLEVYVRASFAKTRISRTLPISLRTMKALKKLISNRYELWDDYVPVFCTVEGGPMDTDTWRKKLSEYSRIIGVKIRPYDLRHVFAIEFLRNGGNTLALKKIMGHSTTSMTERYVNFVREDIKEQHQIASPVIKILTDRRLKRKV